MLKGITPIECFYHWEKHAADQVFLRQPRKGEWIEYTWAEVGERVRKLASYINKFNLEPGSRICLYSSNSADWVMADLAIMMTGHVSVPLYPGQDIESARYILQHANCKLMFLGAVDQLQAIARRELDIKVPIAGLEGCTIEVDYDMDYILQTMLPFTESPVPAKDAMMTILYTSGTTGNPKGVVHLHGTPEKVVPRLIDVLGQDKLGERPRYFSFLPMSHAAERIAVEMVSLYLNPVVSFSEGLETFGAEIQSVQPTFFFAVPRLWVKFKSGIEAAMPGVNVAALSDEQKAGIRRKLGLAEATTVLTGAAPTPVPVLNWFADLGVRLREGYGMTENFIDGSFGYGEAPVPVGSVGKCLPGSEVRIGDGDEILFRGAGTMHGYYLEPEKTAAVIKDGWYHTGDTGRIDENGFLFVTGRVSEVFKTSKGKFVQPIALEDKLATIGEFAQLCVIGHARDNPVLLASLSEKGKALSRDELQKAVVAQFDAINDRLMAHEKIAQVVITKEDWRIDNGLLTPTMKLKRKQIEARFAPLLEGNMNRVVFE